LPRDARVLRAAARLPSQAERSAAKKLVRTAACQAAEAKRAAMADPMLINRLREEGAEPSAMDGPGFGRLIREERLRWAEVVRRANITVD
jgi:tripartite-type tricarboxylate transporter receptor subunit TctC